MLENSSEMVISMIRTISCLITGLLLTGCAAHFPINNGITETVTKPYYLHALGAADRSTDMLVILAFSGGGVRASAFSYGVLKSLAATTIRVDGVEKNLLGEVDLISSVSGGSFTAAYFGLYGDSVFTDYETEFLKADFETGLLLQLMKPINWFKIWQPYFGRAEVASDYYDAKLFHGATFGDLARAGGPAILINATDLSMGEGFGFHQEQFDWICANVTDFSIARAVTASSAVPGLFSAVTLKNYAGQCPGSNPAWVNPTLLSQRPDIMDIAHKIRSYSNIKGRPYIHLVDGGLADNLGLRAVSELVKLHGGAEQTLDNFNLNQTKSILIISVNAAQQPTLEINQSKNPPSLFRAVDAATTIQLNRYNRETIRLFKEDVAQWQQEISAARCGTRECKEAIGFYFVDVSLANIRDNNLRQELQQLPTSFHLESDAIDKLIKSAERLMGESTVFQEFLLQP